MSNRARAILRKTTRNSILHSLYSQAALSTSDKTKVAAWVTKHALPLERPTLFDYLSPSHIKALSCTIPSLDGRTPVPSHRHFGYEKGSLLSPGHLLVFCNPSAPERDLDADATVPLLPPPSPFIRRMWASGKFEFKNPLRIGDDIQAEVKVTNISPKRLDAENPMIIVEQTIATRPVNVSSRENWLGDAYVIETRSHVYVPLTNKSRVRAIKDLSHSDFYFSYTPTDTTLFRFSALTFNAHRIHLDKEYTQNVEKLPERLVHGPLTALMMMEVAENYRVKDMRMLSFDYRATNQLFVNEQVTIHGHWESDTKINLWAQSDQGVVGMTGEATFTKADETWV